MAKFIKISYTGRVKDGEVVDTTDEEVAKKGGIHDENRVYKPLPVVAGEGQVIQGIDEILEDMKKGDEKTVEVPPEKGYGDRDPDLIRLVPSRVFRQQDIKPVPGMTVELDGRPAKVQTVSGGRVRVDFNPELAGKTLVYDVKVEDSATKKKEKVQYLVERSFNEPDEFGIKSKKKILEIEIPEKAFKDRNILMRKASLVGDIFKFLGYNSVKFIENWENPE